MPPTVNADDLDAETERVGILLHHVAHPRRQRHDVLRQRLGRACGSTVDRITAR